VYLCVVELSWVLRVSRSAARSGGRGCCVSWRIYGLRRRRGRGMPCSSIPASTVFSSSDSEGYLNVLRRRCAATVSASLSFSISFLAGRVL